MRIPFVGPTYESASIDLNNQRTINWYPELGGPQGKDVIFLRGTPGLSEWSIVGASKIRRKHHVPGKELYVVSGDTFYVVDRNGTPTSKGTLLTDSGIVGMADNGTEVMIVDGDNGYIYDTTTDTFTQITDADFVGGNTVVFLDGYFIVNDPDTGTFQISASYDGFTWDALDILTAERDPDKIVNMLNSHGQLWVYGRYSTEVFYNAGTSFPFTRMGSVVIEDGLSARWSLARGHNSAYWLSHNKQGEGFIKKSDGYTAKIISTRAIENKLNGFANIEDAVGFCYQEAGHSFYVLTFPSGNWTIVYDESTNMWHERSTYNVGRLRAEHYVFYAGKHLVSDYNSGKIFEMSNTIYTDDGDPLISTRKTPVLSDTENLNQLFISDLQVDFETGTALTTGQGDDPQAMLRVSRDGGHTYGSTRTASIGKKGEYNRRVRWNRLGCSRKFVLELSVADPVNRTIIGAVGDVRAGIS